MNPRAHIDALAEALTALRSHSNLLVRWGQGMAERLPAGARLLAAGNGGSAAEAQHLTAELVGRYQADRHPYSAIALCAESSSVTAISNDYGYDEVFARQVTAHGRAGDILVLLSTSGRSTNLLRAAQEGTRCGLTVWAMTGARPNPLADLADETLALPGDACTVQEAQLTAVHILCEAFEAAIGLPAADTRRRVS
ncbi:D-sedoheptulose-7-phosphate isomerase [Kibdelosporangium phytohabitans]|uniref:Phosphoheptose isomerase n=1 Tax=Kibdelosporangium phytohabitans TaxID=860235 RepID=A0A0N9HTD2_9PSEU|nr:SIS domain-containing protein [Kibdelosporangium phytohabitans]ALG10497.1 phosphoheptose isomerase [Kibdelosporangium phytohabitans]MBE1461587.1 phosphoheptose isomerase [Kibdelosporangium phytohabitans]